MQFEQLLYFTKVAELSSFLAASNDLFISQQALSISIKKLEEELGYKLLERSKNGVTLLDEGKYVYKKAKEILATHDELLTHFHSKPDFSFGKLSVATNHSVKDYTLPKVISFFMREYPNIEINYFIEDNKKIIQMVTDGVADIGLLPYLAIDNNASLNLPPNLKFYPLYKFTFECIASKGSSLTKHKSISMDTISQRKFVIKAYPYVNIQQNLFRQIITHFSPEATIIEVDGDYLYWQLIHDNIAVGLSPQYVQTLPNGIVSIPISDNLKIYGGYILDEEKEKSALLSLYLEKLREYNVFNI